MDLDTVRNVFEAFKIRTVKSAYNYYNRGLCTSEPTLSYEPLS